MNCETIASKLPEIAAGRLAATELADCKQHIAACDDCRDALRGYEALSLLARHEPGPAPEGMLRGITTGLEYHPAGRRRGGFWLGAGFGGAVASSTQ